MAKDSKKNSSARPSQRQRIAKFEREEDLRALQRAEEIKSSSSRMSGARREAKEQQKALNKIAGRKK